VTRQAIELLLETGVAEAQYIHQGAEINEQRPEYQ
jgi:hypothetical protein